MLFGLRKAHYQEPFVDMKVMCSITEGNQVVAMTVKRRYAAGVDTERD